VCEAYFLLVVGKKPLTRADGPLPAMEKLDSGRGVKMGGRSWFILQPELMLMEILG